MRKEAAALKTVEAAPLNQLLRNGRMNQTKLIQRLLMPYDSEPENPFTFGPLLKYGGLQEKTYKMLRKIFDFDLMEMAEYQDGSIQRSLSEIWTLGSRHALTSGTLALENGEVFYICDREIEKGVMTVVKKLAHKTLRTGNFVGLSESLEKKDERKPKDLAGWLELDNDFMFFVDRSMFEKTAKLFGIDATTKRGFD